MAKKIELAFKSGYPNYMYTVTPRKMAYKPYIHVHSIGCSFNVKCWMFNIKQRKQSVHESRWSFLVSNFVIMLQKKVIICFFYYFFRGDLFVHQSDFQVWWRKILNTNLLQQKIGVNLHKQGSALINFQCTGAV